MHEKPRIRLIAYSVAVLAPAVCLLVRWPLWPVLGDAVAHMTFFPAVMIAAYFGGFWPGMLATFLSAVAANYFLNHQLSSFHVRSINDVAALILFVLVGTILSGLSESLHRARRRLVAEERRRAEQVCRESEDRFRQLAENIREIFWTADAKDGRVIYVSPGYEEVWGRTCQSLYGQPRSWLENIHPDDRDRVIENLGQRGRGMFAVSEFRVVRPDGAVRWVRSRTFPVSDPDGGFSRITGLAEDITERKRAEEGLVHERYLLHTLMDNLPDNIYFKDAASRFVRINKALATSFGLNDPAQAIGKTDFDFFTEEHARPAYADEQEIIRTGQPVVGKEEKETWLDGRVRWVSTTRMPWRDKGGTIVGTFGVARDITRLKLAEEALRESEQRWRGLTEALPQLVWSAVPDGTCDYFSTQWTEHTGVAEAELLGWRWLEALHPEDRAPTRQFWLESVAGHHPYDVEYRVRRRDGEYRWFKTRGMPIRDGGGAVVKWFGTCTDITDLRQAEGQLRQAKEAAEAASRAKDEFLANVSHEIRTPMNAILGMTELALDTPLTEDQRQYLRTVKSAADSLLGLINDLLDFSKIEAGKLKLDLADFSLRASLGDALRALAVRAHRKGLELISQVRPDVPDALVGDAGRLRQVLLNLVGNAIKFTEEGEVAVQVELVSGEGPELASGTTHYSPPTAHLRFTMRDTGIGIPREQQERIFRAFEQEDASTTRRYGGTGLGLSIAS